VLLPRSQISPPEPSCLPLHDLCLFFSLQNSPPNWRTELGSSLFETSELTYLTSRNVLLPSRISPPKPSCIPLHDLCLFFSLQNSPPNWRTELGVSDHLYLRRPNSELTYLTSRNVLLPRSQISPPEPSRPPLHDLCLFFHFSESELTIKYHLVCSASNAGPNLEARYPHLNLATLHSMTSAFFSTSEHHQILLTTKCRSAWRARHQTPDQTRPFSLKGLWLCRSPGIKGRRLCDKTVNSK
jgi:hypothetical protein